jgi:cobalt-zinc-cadmium efflux system outer membrane protein
MVGREKKEKEFLRRSRAAAAGVCVVWCLASASARAAETVPATGVLLAAEPEVPSAAGEVEALVAEALANNPELAAARQEAAAAAARVKPAGALPDPMLSVSYENDGAKPSLGTEPMTRLSFMAQQALPFPGKLGLAERVAKADAARLATRPERVALALEGAVRRSYADLLEAREEIRLVEEQLETWRDIEAVIRARYAAGMGTQQDILRAQSERTRLLQQRRRDEAAERTAASELRRLLFRPADSPLPMAGGLVVGPMPPVPAGENILAKALEITPELKDATLARERAKLASELARRNLRPDFVASAAYMNRGGLPLMWSAAVGVSIPLWAGEKQRPLIAEADSLFASASARETSLRRQIQALTEERLIRIDSLSAEAKLDAEGILVQDRLSVDAALASYRTGSVPFVTVLEALGTYFSDRRAAVSRLASLIRAEADLYEFSLDRSAQAPMALTAAASASPKM